MKKGLFFLLLFPNLILARNIAVIDTGGVNSHINSISDRVLKKKCFSETDIRSKKYIEIGQDRDIKFYYIYKRASGCPGGGVSEHTIGGREIASAVTLSNEIHRHTLEDDHLSSVTHIALQNTDEKALLISIPTFASESGNYAAAQALELEPSSKDFIRALNYVLAVRESYNIRVLNLSIDAGVPHLGDSYCDHVNYFDDRREIRDKIKLLVANGVAVVVAAGNQNPVGADRATVFPACLSYVVSVGGYTSSDGKKFLYGATSIAQDYVENAVALKYNNVPDIGTSYAAPKVAGYLSALMAINPTLSTNHIVNTLYNTASHTGKVYHHDTNLKKYHYDRLTPNFTNAKNAIPSPGLSTPITLTEGITNANKYGWKYGTNKHKNGAISKFTTPAGIAQKKSSRNFNQSFSTASITNFVSNVRLSFKAFDIDESDEVKINVNGVFYGYANVTGNNVLGDTQYVTIDSDDLVAVGSDNEITLYVKSPGTTWGITDLLVEVVEVDECLTIDCEVPTAPPVEPSNNSVLLVNAPSGSSFGGNNIRKVTYSFNNLTQSYPSPATFDKKSVMRDLVLSFVFKAGDTHELRNGVYFYINGTLLVSSPLHEDGLEHQYSVVIKRKYLNTGMNSFRFSAKRISSDMLWGIKNIHAEYYNPLELVLGQTSSESYGASGTYEGYSGTRLSFELGDTNNDLNLKIKGWDIDTVNEVKVHINGHAVNFLSQSPANSTDSAVDNFIFPKENLVIGHNVIELTQQYPSSSWSGAEDEKWLVKDLLLTKLLPDLIITDFNKTDNHVVVVGAPFSVDTVVTNIGHGSSSANKLYYYLSSDENISSDDALISSSDVNSIVRGGSLNIQNNITLTSEQKKLFLGVCVSILKAELLNTNNCSEAIELNNITIAPIIYLLLDDSP